MYNRKPLVLITNDDGIYSPGLRALVEAVVDMTEVLIIAPADQQTNMGRGALKGKDVGIIREVAIPIGDGNIKAYEIKGSPSQAVAHGILELTGQLPDFCLSGINYGENLGLAFTCSGTLGAAFEADSFGIPAIAFSRVIPFENQRSSSFDNNLDWEMVMHYTRVVFKKAMTEGMGQGVRILNVNFPAMLSHGMEIRVTQQAYMNCGKYIHPGNRPFDKGYSLGWELNENLNKAPKDSDIYAIHNDGVISVTPMTPIMSVGTSIFVENNKG